MKIPAAIRDNVKLLFGPYKPPALTKGDRAFCLYRDCIVVITSWSDAPIAWPRCRRQDPRGGPGLLVDDELARAVRSESLIAIQHWWRVSSQTVKSWWKAFGVRRMDSEGTRRLILSAAQRASKAARAEDRHRSDTVAKNSFFLWRPEEIALVGVLPDAEVALRLRRTLIAVRGKRRQLGRPNPRHPHLRMLRWTPEADAWAFSLPPAETAARTGHTLAAVYARRGNLRKLGGQSSRDQSDV